MSRDLTVRPATIGDAAALASLGAEVQDLHFRRRPDIFKATALPGLERWFRDKLAADDAKLWIAHLGDVPAGYALLIRQHRVETVFCHERHWYEVDQVGVHPRYRGRGIARELLDHAAEFARAKGLPDIELNTWTFNDAARESFERMGFVPRNLRMERPAGPRPGDADRSAMR
jgi:ribosomal protein S18 acetylase RimI-like enzyme